MIRQSQTRVLLGLWLGLVALASFAGEPVKPFGLDNRTLWTTSRVHGTPGPPLPFTTERVFPNLKFNSPTEMLALAGSNRLFVCEQWGQIFSFENREDVTRADPFLDIRAKDEKNKRQVWGLVFHPKFKENGFVYVSYLDIQPRPWRCRISRFTVKDLAASPPVADPESEYLIFEWIASVDHFGGCMKFGADGYLYFSTGDSSPPGDMHLTGQDISEVCASILRIDVNHPLPNRTYAIPPDNPFVKTLGARGEIWAYGLRNVWRFSFDKPTGELWAADIGQDLWDMIIKIERGGNYGWSVMEGSHPFMPERKRGPTPILKPLIEHEHSEARSLTGGYVYHGRRWPELQGAYVYGDYATGKFWAARAEGQTLKELRELAYTPIRVVSFCEDNDNELFILDHQGPIHRLTRAPVQKKTVEFPRLLSATGLFTSTQEHTPAPGLIPYSVNAPAWADGAEAERWLALPGASKIDYSGGGGWNFPEGTVIAQTYALETERGNPASRRRIETRLLHLELGHWRGYSYIWNDAQTDASLMEDKRGQDRKFEIKDPQAPGGKREIPWRFHNSAECTLCHTMPANFVLGLNTLQMNKDHAYGGVVDNQLRTFEHLGLFSRPITTAATVDYNILPRLPDPANEKQPVELRARAYLHANCSHCHRRWGGGNTVWQLLYTLSLPDTAVLNTPPAHGAIGQDEDSFIIAPGHPERSIIPLRMATTLPGLHMPRVGPQMIDEKGVKLIQEWIRAMPEK